MRYALAVLLLLSLPLGSFAQQQVGVVWDPPSSHPEARKQIERFEELGIRTVMVQGRIDRRNLNLMESRGIGLYATLPFKFVTSRQIYQVDTTMVNLFAGYLNYYHPYSYLKGISLLAYGSMQDTLFRKRLRGIKRVLRPYTNVPILIEGPAADLKYLPNNGMDGLILRLQQTPNTPIDPRIEAVFLEPPASVEEPVSYLNSFLKNAMLLNNKPLLLPAAWVLDQTQSHPKLSDYIRAKTGAGPELTVQPLPYSPPNSEANWMVLVLVLLWGSLAAHYNFNPLYRRSLFRYFRTHRFFLQDIAEWRFRSLIPGLVLMLQHAALGGVMLQALAQYFLSPLGHEALAHHFSWLQWFGDIYYRYFFLGAFLALVVELTQLLWLFLPNKAFKHLSQVMLLFSWPLQLNFLTVTTSATLLLAGRYQHFALILAAGFFLIWLIGFFAAAFDCLQYTRDGKGTYLFWTVLLKLIIIAALTGWFFYNGSLYEVLQLALHLS